MKNILVTYYTQTGQTKEVMQQLLSPLMGQEGINITYHEIKPKVAYPFPWRALQFFDAFPESVLDIPCELEKNPVDLSVKYDLIVLAYQIWYLSPSIPVNSFLQTVEAKQIFKNTPVVTIISCRNMWMMAQEKVKIKLNELGSSVVGNIVFYDKAPNLVSVVTICAWLIGGVREGFLSIFPRSGLSKKDVEESPKYGKLLLESLITNSYQNLQPALNQLGAVDIKPNLMLLEKRGSKLFKVWANFIRKKGEAGDKKRIGRVRLFAICLPTGILLLSPIKAITSFLVLTFTKKKIKKDMDYFLQNALQN